MKWRKLLFWQRKHKKYKPAKAFPVAQPASDQPLYFASHIFCCTNQRPVGHKRGCCATKGAEHLRNYMKKRAKEMGIKGIRVNGAGCLDRCELGPCIVIYPEGVWYSPKNEADIDEILTVHLQQGKKVERLMLPPRDMTGEVTGEAQG